MIRGFCYAESTGLLPVDGNEAPRPQSGGVCWLDVQADHASEIEALAREYELPAEAVEDCFEGEQRPRVDEYLDGDLVFMVMYGALGEGDQNHYDPRKLSIFFTKNTLITVHSEPLRTLDAIHRRCAKRPKYMLGRGLHRLLFEVLDEMVDNYGRLVEALEDRVEHLEEDSLHENVDDSVLARATHLRRELLEFRSVAVSQRELVLPFAKGQYDHVFEGLDGDFYHVRDHLMHVVEVIDNLRELLHGVRDNYHAVLANRMNEIMKTLTIFASLFLPLTLIAGIYGMNTPLWPNVEAPATFWTIIGAMGVVVLSMFGYFRWKRWL